MEKKDTNKTLIIVIIALAAIFCCLLVSCCAFTFYAASRMDSKEMSRIINDSLPSGSPFVSGSETAQTASETLDFTDIDESELNGLSPEEYEIIQVTEQTRGLTVEPKMAPIYQTVDELRQDLMDDLAEVTDEEFAEELGMYTVLGFAPKDFDLRQFYVDMYSEQIAGFYDPEDNTMHLIGDDSPYENAMTLSHEYTHYLQYNQPEFKDTLNYDDDFCEENGETCLIIDALVEGDAVLTETLTDAASLLEGYEGDTGSTAESGVFDNAPKFFQDSLLFPYSYGFDFMFYQYMKGGFDAVNELYLKLPQSIEQIMHPEKYLKDLPVNVNVDPYRAVIEKNGKLIREDVMNESDVMMLLSSGYNKDWQLSERQASTGAEGWGGGTYLFGTYEDKPLFFTKLVWDTEEDAKEAETVFGLYSDKRFGQKQGANSWKDAEGTEVYLIRQRDVLYYMILPEGFNSRELLDLIENRSII